MDKDVHVFPGDYNHDGINIYGDEVATNIYGVAGNGILWFGPQ